MTKTWEFLDKARSLVSNERHKSHGDKGITHANIANLWNAYLRSRPNRHADLDPHEVAAMMALLKIARTLAGEWNPDDYYDGLGYLAIAGELADPDEGVRTIAVLASHDINLSPRGDGEK